MRHTEVERKQDYIWNAAAGMINAAEAVVMSMVVTRITGLADAGMLTIAFAVGNLMMSVGKFGVRNYQVTDVENTFSFAVYLKTRLCTVFLMILTVIGYLGAAYARLGYSRDKIIIIFMVCMIYVVESVEDVFWGYYQQKNRMYAGARMFCFRWLGILIVFPAVLWLCQDLGATLMICLAVSFALFILLLCGSYGRICEDEDRSIKAVLRRGDLGQAWQLIKTVWPLFGILFLSFYVNNAPKYAIDACLAEEVQACYGFVAMPVFVIGLLNSFVYQPTLVPMAIEWESGEKSIFVHRVLKQIIVIVVISIICLAGAYGIGIPVLSWLYHTDLTAYKAELMLLLAAGGFLAISGYLNVVLTIMRYQKELLWPYGLVALLAVMSLKKIVVLYGTFGAAFCYLQLMMLLCLLYGGILIVRLRNHFGREICK